MKKIISILLIATTMFFGVFGISTFATSEKCVKDHFEQLCNPLQYVPENAEGSCGQVALSMFLAFYDSYWNNNFVPDSLEWDKASYNPITNELIKTFTADNEYSTYNTWRGENPSAPFNDFVDENLHQFLHLI